MVPARFSTYGVDASQEYILQKCDPLATYLVTPPILESLVVVGDLL